MMSHHSQFLNYKNMYYILDSAIKKVGVYPQVTDVSPGFNWQAFEKANRELSPVLNNTVPAPVIPMRTGAKVTDALSVVNPSWPFLTVNETLLRFLQGVRADPLRIMPTTAVKKGVSYPYWLVAIDRVRPEYVDYQESRFITGDILDSNGSFSDIFFSNAEECTQFFQQHDYSRYIHATKLILKEEIIQHDIFRLPRYTTPRYFVSDRFREGVDREKITGLGFYPIESAI